MIVVRDVFQLEFGKAKEAIALLRQGQQHLNRGGYAVSRLLADVTGDYYTLVMESTFDSLSAYESAVEASTTNQEWKETYARFVPLVRTGRREIFRSVG